MATADLLTLQASEELLLRDDGVDRWIIRGQLRERPMTRRNRFHSQIMVRIAKFLDNWVDLQPEPRGTVLCGEAGCILQRDPEIMVGIDVVYLSPELAAHNPTDTTLVDGVPTLVVEILSPNDVAEDIDEKIDTYLDVGVALVWIIDSHDKTVTIYQPGQEPALVTLSQTLSAEPQLPGFRVAVAEIFR